MKKLPTPTFDLLNYQVFIHSIGALIGLIYGFVDSHIWSPAETYFLVMSLVLLDFCTGILYAYKSKGYCEIKAQRVIFTMLAYTSLLFYTFQFSKAGGVMPLLTHIVFVPMVAVTMISLVKNFRLLGWINRDLAFTINQKLDSKIKEDALNVNPAASEPVLPTVN
ncbi:hypothetical protein [Adhaeribacter pallidiroseus]|uniref:Uncharacterized protein n=1 Tax=Adhaeribacter pallidiroseus TaxID=2072847 RepID=A0A369QEY8_9BACT|nr:hypothetical protein [Adhaeribacter pallidiroseus]RDC63274.1 hypothetical protein AHMF7616_01876 [Adhaeribacter pallidiroseus]